MSIQWEIHVPTAILGHQNTVHRTANVLLMCFNKHLKVKLLHEYLFSAGRNHTRLFSCCPKMAVCCIGCNFEDNTLASKYWVVY